MGNEYFENALMQNTDAWYEKYKAEKRKVEQAKKIIITFLQLRNGKVLDCCKDKECPCENPLCETINEQAEQFLKETTKNEE